MPVEYQFPDPCSADPDGLLAVGGDLNNESLITAYSQGIFPWYDENSPILWWSPDPRLVLFPEKFRVSSSLRQRIRSKTYEVRTDTNFEGVIRNCAAVKRNDQHGTWITEEMMQAYINLHCAGLAHSFETYFDGTLVGGLYGVSLGRAFFGESMFYHMRDASKVAFSKLVEWAVQHQFHFIDAQQSTSHLQSLGAEEISRIRFMQLLQEALHFETLKGRWNLPNAG